MYCDWPTFQRCCFCMPLRRGVLVIAYLKFIFSAFMVGVYSFVVHFDRRSELVYNFSSISLPGEICVLIYCIEIVVNATLIYGAHKKNIRLLKICYYYFICTTLVTLLMEMIELSMTFIWYMIELIVFSFLGLCLQIYLLLLLWSLIKKWEMEGPGAYENQLHQFVNSQAKVEANGVYNPSTVPVEV